MRDTSKLDQTPEGMPVFPPPKERWPQRYTMMALLLIAMFLCYIDRIIISIAVIEMDKEFNWSDSDKGLVLSIFFSGYLLMQMMGGILSNRFGGRSIFLIAVLLWSLFTVLTPPAAYVSFAVLIFVRFMLGFGEGAAFPAAYNLIHGWMPVEERSLSIGLLSGISAIGTVIALFSTPLIISAYGWPSVFYIFGSLGLVWSIIWILKIPASAPLEPQQVQGDRKVPWRLMLTHPSVVVLYIMGLGAASISYMMASWLPSYFVDTFQLSTQQAGFYSIIPWVAVFFGTIASGRYADKRIANGENTLCVRKRLVFTGSVTIALSLIFLATAPTPTIAVALVTFLFIGLSLLVPGYSPIPAELLPKYGDILYGFIAAFGSLGSVIYVSLTGILLDVTGSYTPIFLTMAGTSVLGYLVFHIFGSTTPIEFEQASNTSLAS